MQIFNVKHAPAQNAQAKPMRIIGFIAASAMAAVVNFSATQAVAAEETVKIAVVVPLAGAFAPSGQDILNGAKMAADEINASGGIKSLGGRKIELIIGDAGQSPETAVTTARRVLNQGPVAAIGSWYSSLTLAATQIAEQKKIPWVTGSVADAITNRGFKYVYKISAGSQASAEGLIEAINMVGSGKLRLALLTDNNTANVDIKGYIKKKIDASSIVSEQTWTPPLADATPAINAVLRSNPDIIYLAATSTTDQTLILKQLVAQGNTAPVIMGASSAANPTFREAVGDKGMEGVIVVTGVSFPGKGADEISRKYSAVTKQSFMACEGLTGYVNIYVIAQALEKAGKAEPEAVNLALRTMDIQNFPVFKTLPGGSQFKFGPDGSRQGTAVQLLQWQGGQPRVVFPAELSTAVLKKKL